MDPKGFQPSSKSSITRGQIGIQNNKVHALRIGVCNWAIVALVFTDPSFNHSPLVWA